MSDTDSPIVLTTYRHELEAGLLVNHLRERGIEARSTGSMVSGGRVEIPADVEVLVPSGQLESAQSILTDLKTNEDEVDWDAVDVGEPIDGPVAGSGSANEIGGRTNSFAFAFINVIGVVLVIGYVVSYFASR